MHHYILHTFPECLLELVLYAVSNSSKLGPYSCASDLYHAFSITVCDQKQQLLILPPL
jgi:hypothetical protein